MSSTIGLNICAIITRIKKYKLLIYKKKKHNEKELLAKTNLDCTTDLIFRSLTDSYLELDYFYLIDVLIKYNYMKEENSKLETS